ncbi:MAG: FHA domain-containing protein [Anaerolineaceae bacterium]
MAGPVEYLDLIIDVFDNTGQRARVKKALTAGELVGEVLREFDDLDQKAPEAYALFLRGEEKPLERGLNMEQLNIQDHDELVFKHSMPSERQASAAGAKQYYLVEVKGGTRHEIRWQPAIIGRPDNDPAHNELLAVNLQNSPGGMSISRRHAQVTFESEQYFLEPLSATNPTFLNDAPLPTQTRALLKMGDHIFLGTSRIELVFTAEDSQKVAAVRRLVARLVVTFSPGEAAGGVYPVSKIPFTLGRKDCDLTLPGDMGISRRHALLGYNEKGGIYTLADLGGVNGTQVNGVPLQANQPVPLSGGEEIQLGPETKLRFEVEVA